MLHEYINAGHLSHGYAITVHKAQGMTCDDTFFLGDDGLYNELAYTGMSRGRNSNRLYTVRPVGENGRPHPDPFSQIRHDLGSSRAKTAAIDHRGASQRLAPRTSRGAVVPRRQPGVTKYVTGDGRTRWQYVADLGDDPETGRRRQRHRRGFATQAEAAAPLEEARRAMEVGGRFFDVEHMTFLEYLDVWLDGLPQTDMKPCTISDYRNETRRYIRPNIADVKLSKLTPLHLEQLYRTLLDHGGRNGRPLSPKTVLRVHRVIPKAIGDAERKGIVQRNVARLADKPSTSQLDTERPAWTVDEPRTFLAAAEHHELFALFRLAALTGMRRGELCGLRWDDVDLAGRTLRVCQARAMVDGRPTIEPPKSRRSRRTIDLDDKTVEVLRQHRRRQVEAAELVGDGWQETGYVFTTVIGTPQHPDNVNKRFVELVRTLDVTYLTLTRSGEAQFHWVVVIRTRRRVGRRWFVGCLGPESFRGWTRVS